MPVMQELFQAERIGAEKPVLPGVPVSRMAQVLGMIQNGQPDALSVDIAIVIPPVRAPAPDPLFTDGAIGIDHVTCGRRQCFDNAYGKCTFLGVPNPQWSVVGMDGKLAIDDPHLLITTESVGLGLLGDLLLIRSH